MERTPRTLPIPVAKVGLDGHDRGAKVVARGLADAGYEVIYSSLHQTPEMGRRGGGAGVGRRVGLLDLTSAGRFGVSWGRQLTEGES